MDLVTNSGAVLLVLALLASALPALAFERHRLMLRRRGLPRFNMRNLARFWSSELGVVITYTFPGGPTGPTTTAPTAAAASQLPTQTAQVFFADADAQAVVVHNMGLPASFPTFLFPEVWMVKSLGGASDSSFASNFTFGLTNTNSITINKINVGTGSGGTYNVYIRRPHSAGL